MKSGIEPALQAKASADPKASFRVVIEYFESDPSPIVADVRRLSSKKVDHLRSIRTITTELNWHAMSKLVSHHPEVRISGDREVRAF